MVGMTQEEVEHGFYGEKFKERSSKTMQLEKVLGKVYRGYIKLPKSRSYPEGGSTSEKYYRIYTTGESFFRGLIEPAIDVEDDIEELRTFFEVDDLDSVRTYLKENPDLVEYVKDSIRVIKDIFKDYQKVTLNLVADSMTGEQLLFARIVPSIDHQEALKRLDELDNKWHLSVLDKIGGKYTVTLW